MSEKLVTVAWIKNDVDPEVGFIGVIAHDREIEGAYAVVRRSCAESLLAKRDATIAQQAEEIERLKTEVSVQSYWGPRWDQAQQQITQQAGQLAAAQKDARRYRWLNSNSKHIKWIPSNYNKDVVSGFSAFSTGYLGFGFEEAIDAAIAAQEVKS